MRKIIVSEFISLDGVMEGPGPDDPYKHAGWTMAYGNEESMKFKLDETLSSGALLLGRTTYEGFASAWPGRTDEMGFADKMNSMPKYIVSKSLKKPSWNNTHVIKDNVVEEISKLKKEEGEAILVAGSSILTNSLLDNKLVDELRLLVFPIVLGIGKRLFKDGMKITLELVEERTFETGVVLLVYRPA